MYNRAKIRARPLQIQLYEGARGWQQMILKGVEIGQEVLERGYQTEYDTT